MAIMAVSHPTDGEWFKSSFSLNGGQCVEVRFTAAGVQLRDDKIAESPVLTFSRAEWEAFLLGAWNGEFDIC